MAEGEEKGAIAPPMLLMAVAVVAVSTSSLFVVWSTSEPLTIALFRLVYSTLFVLPLAIRGKTATTKDMALMALAGLSLSAHFYLWITSLSHTSVAESVLLVTTHPVPVALASSYFLREVPNRLQIAGIAAAVTGATALMIYPLLQPGGVGGDHLLGNVLAFLGGLAMVPYLVIGRAVRPRVGLWRYVLVVYGIALAATIVFVLASGVPFLITMPREHALFITMALVPGILGHTVYNYLLKHVPAFLVSSTLLLEPVGAAILAFFLLSQGVDVIVAGAGGLLLFGLYLIIRGQTHRKGGEGKGERSIKSGSG